MGSSIATPTSLPSGRPTARSRERHLLPFLIFAAGRRSTRYQRSHRSLYKYRSRYDQEGGGGYGLGVYVVYSGVQLRRRSYKSGTCTESRGQHPGYRDGLPKSTRRTMVGTLSPQAWKPEDKMFFPPSRRHRGLDGSRQLGSGFCHPTLLAVAALRNLGERLHRLPQVGASFGKVLHPRAFLNSSVAA